ncbi:IS701 family transposase [Enterococcus cecorum]|uniref:IS701 family transposase n=1 Tax=Enterococcus cecorum TaxID=44008 RepID=UPI003F92E3DC
MTQSYQTTKLISITSIIFKIFTGTLSTPTLMNFSGLVLATICITGIASVRSFYNWFLRLYYGKSLNTYYHTLSVIGEKLGILELKVLQSLLEIDRFQELSSQYPVLFLIDDTLQPKYGKKFAYVKVLHDHALHTGKAYVNTHDFVTLGIAFPIQSGKQVEYIMFPFSMRMYIPGGKSKLKLAEEMATAALMTFKPSQHIIVECDSRYPKKELLDFVKLHQNVDFIANIRKDTALFELPEKTSKRGRPRKYGKKFSCTDIAFSDSDGTYEVGMTYCLTHLFSMPVYVVRTKKSDQEGGRLFISTIDPEKLPAIKPETQGLWCILEYYEQRWKIETYFYEIKTFWSFGSYQVRSYEEIERMNFLINFTYGLIKILPLIDSRFSALMPQGTSARKNSLSRVILEEQIFHTLGAESQNAKNKRPNIRVLFRMPLKNG